MAPYSSSNNVNKCWTCRRRRVKCDRLVPTCSKCANSNHQCLGYGQTKPLRWTNSIASRGKMKDKTFDVKKLETNQPTQPADLLGWKDHGSSDLSSAWNGVGSIIPFHAEPLNTQKCATQSGHAWRSSQEMSQWMCSYSTFDFNCGSAASANSSIVTLTPLMEPGLQDLLPVSRKYISYFEQQCCKECVLYDIEGANPFREFMRFIPYNAGLCHTIISIAALHLAYRDVKTHQHIVGPTWDILAHCYSPRSRPYAPNQPRSSDVYHDYLFHKQKALVYLKKESQEGFIYNHDGTIASILLFLWLETLESGKKSWKYHLDGLRELMRRRKPLISQQCAAEPTPNKHLSCVFSRSQGYFDTTYIVFDIIGSTLVQKKSYQTPFTTSSFLDTLKRSENQTWVGCPAELLHLLSHINCVSSNSKTQTIDFISALLIRLNGFSPREWAMASTDASYFQPRYHLACAYKAAVQIYASRVLIGLAEQKHLSKPYFSDFIDCNIIHLTAIDPQDVHLKCLIWPAFVTGAEAQTKAQRTAILKVFGHLWDIWRSQNVHSAVEVLENIWARDSSTGAQSWIEHLYEQGEDWLFL